MANDADVQTAAQNTEQEIDKFQGFATKDGEVEKPAGAPSARVPNTGKFVAKGAPRKDADEGGDDGTDGDDKDGKHADANKRIGQAVGRQRAAERRADAAEARATATEARLAAIEARLTAPANKDTAPKAPDPKDYDGGEYDARYLADVAKFEARAAVAEARKEVREETNTATLTAAQQRQVAEFEAKKDTFFAKATEQYDDFEDVVAAATTPLSAVMAELGMDSEYGPQILYELASDPKEAARIAKLSGAQQAAWFGRQEARLTPADTGADDDDGGEETPLPGPKSKVSKAPAVPEFNTRGTGQPPKVSGATTDFAAFERAAAVAQK